MQLASAAKALGGDIVRGAILCPGPGHSRGDRSLSVTFRHDAPGGFVVNSFAGDDPLFCKDHVRAALGFRDVQSALVVRATDEHGTSTLEAARRLWREAVATEGSPAAGYLAGRGLSLPAGASGAAVRYHGACPFKGARTPAILALVRDVQTNEPRGIHRTAITRDGRKAIINGECRAALGPIAGGAVKLSEDADVTTCLGVGEGIESTLSLRRLPEFGLSPAWAMLNAGNLGKLPVLAGIECLWIAEDHDDAGQRAADHVAGRWSKAGCEVFRVRAKALKADLNDVLTGALHA